ncbi:hypothetical protein Fmac_011727 [Flemingia macrophylla]|uniref:glutathione gamma-glutamylcysteinyltransferase n=1 Tax=Flemingia macrophylla TaxID=520843 RepID=A0ABD1MNA1_9FABA
MPFASSLSCRSRRSCTSHRSRLPCSRDRIVIVVGVARRQSHSPPKLLPLASPSSGSPFIFCDAVTVARPSVVLPLAWPEPGTAILLQLTIDAQSLSTKIGVSVDDLALLSLLDTMAEMRIEGMAMKVPMTRLRKQVATRLNQNTFAMLTTFNEVDVCLNLTMPSTHSALESHVISVDFLGQMNGYCKRPFPSSPGLELHSPGQKLFHEAIQNGTMECFLKLISYFQTQSEPTLSMVLNALAIDHCRRWKGSWRWFDESMLDLDCCVPLENVRARGISFRELVCLAQSVGAKVEACRASSSNIEEFHMLLSVLLLRTATSSCHTTEKLLKRYYEGKDMALIFDVARFKHSCRWVPLEALWKGMSCVVDTIGQTRGFMVLSRPHKETSMHDTLVLKKFGIEKFDPMNEPFESYSHDAVCQIQILPTVLKAAYMLYDRVIRLTEVDVTQAVQDEE